MVITGCTQVSQQVSKYVTFNGEQSTPVKNSAIDRLPTLTKENSAGYTRAIVRSSHKQCIKLVKSISQDLESCIYNLANRYFARLYEEGLADRLIHLDAPKKTSKVYAEM